MNCKQGDMALVVRSHANNEGRVVTCLEYIGEGPMRMVIGGKLVRLEAFHWWRVDRPMNLLQGGKIFLADFANVAADECLIPINGLGDTIKSRETEEEPA